MTKQSKRLSHEDKVFLVEQFVGKYYFLNGPVRTEYNSEWDAFEVFGYTNMDWDGQYTTVTKPAKVYVWVSETGKCSFTSPPRAPWGENPNDI